ncbi:MAG: hypothetical protein VKO21_06960 [Candidatus Sericytochromatia bacterium]|nr:hypothetical protein [Candidatus Sericytochromatia bacterium]
MFAPLARLSRPLLPTAREAANSPRPAAVEAAATGKDRLQFSSGMQYRGQSAGHLVLQTAEDLTIARAHDMKQVEPTFSLKSHYESLARTGEEGSLFRMGEAQVEARIEAQVGRYLSLRESLSGHVPGAAHAWADTTLKTLDMATGKPIRLTDLFPAKDIHAALLQDPIMRKALEGDRPADLDSLISKVSGYRDPDGVYALESSLLDHFSLHRLEGGKVAVRVALPYGVEVYRGHLTQLELKLPVPPGLADDLRRAADRSAGILAPEAEKVLAGRSTVIETEPGLP